MQILLSPCIDAESTDLSLAGDPLFDRREQSTSAAQASGPALGTHGSYGVGAHHDKGE